MGHTGCQLCVGGKYFFLACIKALYEFTQSSFNLEIGVLMANTKIGDFTFVAWIVRIDVSRISANFTAYHHFLTSVLNLAQVNILRGRMKLTIRRFHQEEHQRLVRHF